MAIGGDRQKPALLTKGPKKAPMVILRGTPQCRHLSPVNSDTSVKGRVESQQLVSSGVLTRVGHGISGGGALICALCDCRPIARGL